MDPAAVSSEALRLFQQGRVASSREAIASLTEEQRQQLGSLDRCALALASATCARPGDDSCLGLLDREIGILERSKPGDSPENRRGVAAMLLLLGCWLARLQLEADTPQVACDTLGRVALAACSWCGASAQPPPLVGFGSGLSPGAHVGSLWLAMCDAAGSNDQNDAAVSRLAHAWALSLMLSGRAEDACGLLAACRRHGIIARSESAALLEALALSSGSGGRSNNDRAKEVLEGQGGVAAAYIELALQDDDQAGDACSNLGPVTETTSAAFNFSGMLLSARGELQAAMAHFQSSLKGDSAALAPVMNLALLFWFTGCAHEARELFLFLVDRRRAAASGAATATATLAFPVPAAFKLPGLAALLWAVSVSSIAQADFPMAQAALDEIGSPRGTFRCPFRRSEGVSPLDVARARSLVLLEQGMAQDALRVALEVTHPSDPSTCLHLLGTYMLPLRSFNLLRPSLQGSSASF